MDFLIGQDNLTLVQWILRALVAFIFMLIIMRMVGARTISHLTLPDLVISLVIGNIIAHPLSDPHLGLAGAFTTTIVFTLLYLVVVRLSLISQPIKKLIEPHPITLIESGQIQFSGLRDAHMSVELLQAELRKNKIARLQDVSLAVYEPGGQVSVLPNPNASP